MGVYMWACAAQYEGVELLRVLLGPLCTEWWLKESMSTSDWEFCKQPSWLNDLPVKMIVNEMKECQ